MNQDPFWLTDEQFSKIAPHRQGVRFREPPRWPGPGVMGASWPIAEWRLRAIEMS